MGHTRESGWPKRVVIAGCHRSEPGQCEAEAGRRSDGERGAVRQALGGFGSFDKSVASRDGVDAGRDGSDPGFQVTPEQVGTQLKLCATESHHSKKTFVRLWKGTGKRRRQRRTKRAYGRPTQLQT